MRRKIVILLFIIILLIINVNTLNAKVNDKKDINNDPKNKTQDSSSKQKSVKVENRGQSNKDKNTNEAESLINLNVYSDIDCALPLDNINWGEIEIGGAQSIVLYIKNNGRIDTFASLITENWYPENAMEYMTLSWDYNEQIIPPGEVVAVTICLEVSEECPLLNDFSFNLIIIGS